MSTCPMEFFFMWDNLTMPFTCSIYGFTVHRYAVHHLNYLSTSALTRNFYLIKVIKEAIFPFSELILKFNLPPRICNHHPVAILHFTLQSLLLLSAESRPHTQHSRVSPHINVPELYVCTLYTYEPHFHACMAWSTLVLNSEEKRNSIETHLPL